MNVVFVDMAVRVEFGNVDGMRQTSCLFLDVSIWRVNELELPSYLHSPSRSLCSRTLSFSLRNPWAETTDVAIARQPKML